MSLNPDSYYFSSKLLKNFLIMIKLTKNKYILFVSKKKFYEILLYFILDTKKSKISKIIGISQILLEKYLNLRILMAIECKKFTKFG